MTDLVTLLRGYLMGAADVVPGVSGGTVALVVGIYERLVHSIHAGAGALGALVRGRGAEFVSRAKSVEWRFLLVLVSGIALAIVSLARLIEYLLDEQPRNTAAVFFGLVAASIFIAWRLVAQWTPGRLTVALLTAAGAFIVLGLRSDEVTDPGTALFFGAGAVAIVAMILPGISGSFILLMLGMYESVLAAVNERDLAVIATFGVGAVLGLALFATFLDRMLRDHHDTVMAFLVGLMAGSLRVLWPWPDGTDTARLGAPRHPLVPVVLALAGAAVVLAIARLGDRAPQPSRAAAPRP